MIDLPDKTFDCIYADPPWHYDDKSSRGVCHKYDLQSTEWIASLPIAQVCNDDCILFMWATFPKLKDAFEVIEGWGFEYKTGAFTWVKTNVKGMSWFWGMGNWTRSNAELCLLATRGKPKRIGKDVHSVIMHPIMQHSRKPDIARKKIRRLMGKDCSVLELFARESSHGFEVWGNQTDHFEDEQQFNLEFE